MVIPKLHFFSGKIKIIYIYSTIYYIIYIYKIKKIVYKLLSKYYSLVTSWRWEKIMNMKITLKVTYHYTHFGKYSQRSWEYQIRKIIKNEQVFSSLRSENGYSLGKKLLFGRENHGAWQRMTTGSQNASSSSWVHSSAKASNFSCS